MLRARTVLLPLLIASLLLAPRAALAQCTPVAPVACPNCFAVVVMPDTQMYTHLSTQPAGANHLDLVTRYICDHRTAWTEPTTGKTMPILMVIQLGDLVEKADLTEAVAGPLAEWKRVSAAFDNLDECTPPVPYLVTAGNHDIDNFLYHRYSEGYHQYFGVDRWNSKGYACTAPDDCDWEAGQYFLGGGELITPLSRNNLDGFPGPATPQPGRHRAGIIRAPNGQPFLFLGLELAFDFPPAETTAERDDSAWPKQILEAHPRVPTVVFHHSMLWMFDPPDTRLRWGPENWESDSIEIPPGDWNAPNFGTSGGMEEVYDLLVEPYPQVRFLFTGHVYNPTNQADYTIPRGAGPPVWAFLRNFQRVDQGLDGNADRYGVGWNVIAVFDPDAQQVRVRSYRIDDVENYANPPLNYLHAGTPAPTECLQTDQNGVGERIIQWDFKTAGATTPGLSSAGAILLATVVGATAVWSLGRARRR